VGWVAKKGVMLIVNTIVLAAGAVMTSVWGDVPVHNFWFWFSVWLMIYYNHVRSVAKAMPKPRDQDSPWYHWLYDSAQEGLRNRKAITPADLLESAEFIKKLAGFSSEGKQ
jgi:hypothetical protein